MAIMPTCKEMSALASGAMEYRLPLIRRFFIRLHLLMCPHCVAARAQLLLLREAAGRFDDFCALEDTGRILTPEAAQRIKAMLNCPPAQAG